MLWSGMFVSSTRRKKLMKNEKIPRTRKLPLDYLSSSNSDSFLIAAATSGKIKIIINSMKNGKAVGPNSISVYLLKILSEYI